MLDEKSIQVSPENKQCRGYENFGVLSGVSRCEDNGDRSPSLERSYELDRIRGCVGFDDERRECTVAPKEKPCYRCSGVGHISRDCPQAPSGDGYSGATGGQECYKCGHVGHIARNCSQGGYSGDGYGGRQHTCYSCGGHGHMARDCTHGQKCYNCGEVGHVSRDCPSEARGERVCYKCKQPGHVQAACPN
ncbi:unnamed protein product [Aspergillus oryzae RIB40]|uniref:DNA, SC012 n=2 Tax=Aspergillus oryzae TaxID=5062 RepID=Q2UBG0_ASPOR|nr:unnamed protein product [Aspergillus oryzae RIB40]EIT80305.1 E3 ubiquitin ligase interacting with arginine methyltransferase [Aspergillus oryzae 3.042]KDE77080.1 E3 ubiquitin ligase interacting with arginine methyltransferase [Aspergillus oryzae 100-8]BAE61105.1 unnamed protein product [Aspergillus oryzae RIB40]|eukprot:EIT80305.1 E3 ubiquitin ligase interacting with arginine methyltransferase [Aspergillus oryzae 3.042]